MATFLCERLDSKSNLHRPPGVCSGTQLPSCGVKGVGTNGEAEVWLGVQELSLRLPRFEFYNAVPSDPVGLERPEVALSQPPGRVLTCLAKVHPSLLPGCQAQADFGLVTLLRRTLHA